MNELPIPQSAVLDSKCSELIRIWAKSQGQDFVVNPHYKDPFAWGILIVDMIHQVSMAYQAYGLDPDDCFKRILEGFRAEMARSTDFPE